MENNKEAQITYDWSKKTKNLNQVMIELYNLKK